MKTFKCPQSNKAYSAKEVLKVATRFRDFSPRAAFGYDAYCPEHPNEKLGSGGLTMSIVDATPLAKQLDNPSADPPIISNNLVKRDKDYD